MPAKLLVELLVHIETIESALDEYSGFCRVCGCTEDSPCEGGGRTSRCPNPNCGGWAPGTSQRAVCVKCSKPADEVRLRMTAALEGAGRVLRHPGFGLRVEGVVLDLETIELLQSLAAVMDTAGSALVSAAPPELQRRLRRWASRPAPAVLVDVEARPADTDTDTDTDEGDDSRIALPALGVMG